MTTGSDFCSQHVAVNRVKELQEELNELKTTLNNGVHLPDDFKLENKDSSVLFTTENQTLVIIQEGFFKDLIKAKIAIDKKIYQKINVDNACGGCEPCGRHSMCGQLDVISVRSKNDKKVMDLLHQRANTVERKRDE